MQLGGKQRELGRYTEKCHANHYVQARLHYVE